MSQLAPFPTPSPASARSRSVSSRELDASARTGRRLKRAKSGALGRYEDSAGRLREVLARPGLAGSVLVLDCDALNGEDPRLVAHLFPDEPAENAALICRHYLSDPRGRRCRRATPQDLGIVPCGDEAAWPGTPGGAEAPDLRGPQNASHRLELVQGELSVPELRWRRHPVGGGELATVSVRDVIGFLERYEPVRAVTVAALVRHRDNPRVSTSALRAELERVHRSRIVLNRGLRLAVLAAIRTQGLSMSEIATRCGRIKRDGRGNQSGETSWLSRRLGIAPEGGRCAPTPWVHTEVLALIARRGLGVSPHEVEVD